MINQKYRNHGKVIKEKPSTLNDEERNLKMVWGDEDDDHKDWKRKQED